MNRVPASPRFSSVKLGGKRSFFTGDLAKFRWRNLLPQTVSAEARVTLYSEGIEALGNRKKAAHLPGLFRDIFRNAFLKFRDGRIITRVSVGKWAFLDEAVAINQDLTALTPTDDRLMPEFLKCVAPQLAAQIDASAVGVGVRGVTRESVGDLELPLPPLEEQRRIVAKIEGYQKVLDGARQILAASKTRITVEPDWPMESFEQLCERVQYGLSVPLNEEGRGMKPFRMAELVRGRAFDNGAMKCADIEAKEVRKYRLVKGDLLFNRTTSCEHVGRTGIFSLDGEYVFASYLIRLSIKRDLAEPEYVNAWMNTAEFQTGVKTLASRAIGQSNISASSLAGYEIPLPPMAEQRRIVSELDAEAAQMEAVRALLPRFEAKIQRVLDRVLGNGSEANV
jgi:type I restriction enzyme M protein